MPMTLAEKILARASGQDLVIPDQTVLASVDVAMSHENADLVREAFQESGTRRIWDPERIVIILDHRVPAESEKTAARHRTIREFVSAQGIRNFYDIGRGGICHQVLAENGHVWPGMLVVGTDPHTTTNGAFGAFATGIGAADMAGVWADGKLRVRVPATIRVEVEGQLGKWISAKDLILYIIGQVGATGAEGRAVEFDGSAIRALSVASRMVLANLSMEMGAVAAFTPVDERLVNYLMGQVGRTVTPGTHYAPDAGAHYEKILRFDAGQMLAEPQVACPPAVDHVKRISEVGNVSVDQAVLGTCANGRLEDLEMAVYVLDGRKVHPHTRLLIIPASQHIYLEAIRLGYLETLVRAGAMVNPPGCGPCLGAHQGILANGEICISSTNRNLPGRMGGKESQVYLASPAVVAASAVAGRIVHPREIAA